MKASVSWLKELVPGLTATADEIAKRFTSAGLEVEAMHPYGKGAEACIVAKVVSMRPHPQKSGLRLVTVDLGGREQEVVCGAPNVPDPGGLVVFAPLGAHLPAKGMTIEKRTIAGVVSEGMLCSESELGLSDESDGILILPEGLAVPGTNIVKAVPGMNDTILEVNTLNRADALGHVGLAREIAALYGLAFKLPAPLAIANIAAKSTSDVVSVEVKDKERCPHYAAHAVFGVKIAPSPLSVRYRLGALGVRAISNLVDVTNLAMFLYGHPMHAFDLDRVKGGKIVVRRASEGEAFTSLDGVARKLVSDDLVIADGEVPTALAGVMGGAISEISSATTNVLFECAYFEPRGVRRASRRHGLHTESSHRFERGVDPSRVPDALAYAVGLTTSWCKESSAAKGSLHVVDGVARDDAGTRALAKVTLRAARLDQLLGVHVPFEEALKILESLGFACENKGDSLVASVPTHRHDVLREVDLIDEVVRFRGLDSIPSTLPAIRPSREVGEHEELSKRARAAAVAMGLSEAITYSFTSEDVLAKIGAPKPTVILKNPLTEHHAVMRTSVLTGLLEALSHSKRHGEHEVRLFTIGPVFLPAKQAGGLPDERLHFAAILAGHRTAYLEKPQPVDAWDAKGLAEGFITRLFGRDAHIVDEAASIPWLHPRARARIELGGVPIGHVGLLHPDVHDGFDLGDAPVCVMALDLSLVHSSKAAPRFTAIPKFPPSPRDIALVVKDSTRAGDIAAAIRAAAGDLATDVFLFDRFTGGQVPPGHASLAYRVVYRASERTLTDAEVDASHAKVVADVEAKFGAQLRS